MKSLHHPKKGEYPLYFSTYLNLVSGINYEEQIHKQIDSLKDLFERKGEEWSTSAYEQGKWTPKEVLGHIIDTERIMTIRALCFARGEKSPMPGFDQDPYVLNARFNFVPLRHLLDDFQAQRIALLSMIRTLPEDSLDLLGIASGKTVTPRALFWFISGHFTHHFNILNERY